MTEVFKITKLSFILIGVMTLNSCWNNPSQSDLIVGNYYVGWNDLSANRSIMEKLEKNSPYSTGIISSYVYSIGHNSHFIIAKQHPYLDDLAVTKYFVIDINKRESTNNDGVYGPMDKPEFDKKTRELNISELKFDLVFNEKPN